MVASGRFQAGRRGHRRRVHDLDRHLLARLADGAEVDVIRNLSGTAIGAGSLVCHVINPKAPPKCAVSFNLPGGYLFFSVTGTKTGAAGPEVGGTGRYAHTTGKVVATGISQTKTKVVVTLHR